jgi:hypothetical protein
VKYDNDTAAAKLRNQELEIEHKSLLKDKLLVASAAEELKDKLQVFRKHVQCSLDLPNPQRTFFGIYRSPSWLTNKVPYK